MDMKHEQIPDLRQLLRALPGADVPAMHLTVLADGPLTPQQITAAFLDSLIPTVTDSGDVDRDPYEQLRFAKRLMDRQGELLQVCWDEEDEFFYDVDKHGCKRRVRNISITNVFTERVMDKAMADRVFDRYFRGGKEFDTPYPWPSVSSGDALFERRKEGNSWGYYCQALTMLRTLRWMKHYGYEDEMHRNMRIWLNAWTDAELPFGQELDPFTGKPSKSSPWYSSGLLFYLVSAKELGIWTENCTY